MNVKVSVLMEVVILTSHVHYVINLFLVNMELSVLVSCLLEGSNFHDIKPSIKFIMTMYLPSKFP